MPAAGLGSGSAGNASGGFPNMLLGVINPIFLRSLSRYEMKHDLVFALPFTTVTQQLPLVGCL